MSAPVAPVSPSVESVAGLEPPIPTLTTDIGADEWDRYVESHPHATADHLSMWRHVFEGVFAQQCYYVAARRHEELVGVLPLVRFRSMLFGRFLVSVPFLNYGGVLASDSSAARALLGRAAEVGREFGASHVELRHRLRHFAELPARQHKVAMQLRLPASADTLWKTIDRKVRNQVRKAQKEGLEPTDGGAEHLDEFYTVFSRNMRDLGTPVYPVRLFSETLRLSPGRTRIHLVRYRGRTVASALTVSFRDTVLVPWASSLREYRTLCPNVLLYWSMLERAIADGARLFDFGRSSSGSGTHHFKQQWGAEESPLFWEYVLLSKAEAPDQGPSNSRFSIAIEAWKRLPLWAANRIGPSIVRNIP